MTPVKLCGTRGGAARPQSLLTDDVAQLQARQVDGGCEGRRLGGHERRWRRPTEQTAAVAEQQRRAHGRQTQHRHTGHHGHHHGAERCGGTGRGEGSETQVTYLLYSYIYVYAYVYVYISHTHALVRLGP